MVINVLERCTPVRFLLVCLLSWFRSCLWASCESRLPTPNVLFFRKLSPYILYRDLFWKSINCDHCTVYHISRYRERNTNCFVLQKVDEIFRLQVKTGTQLLFTPTQLFRHLVSETSVIFQGWLVSPVASLGNNNGIKKNDLFNAVSFQPIQFV